MEHARKGKDSLEAAKKHAFMVWFLKENKRRLKWQEAYIRAYRPWINGYRPWQYVVNGKALKPGQVIHR
jgi:hypothetical protein